MLTMTNRIERLSTNLRMATFLTNETEHMHRAVRSPEQVQSCFRQSGISVVEWAARNGFSPALVYAVIKGKRKCLRGESHRIAVALGMKHELPSSTKMT